MKRILAISALLLASAAPAADAVVADYSRADGVKALNGLGHCLASARRGAAEQATALPFGSPEQARAAIAFLGPENSCFASDVEFDFEPNLFVGGMAEELFLSRYGQGDVAAFAAAAVEPRNQVEDLGLCVVRRNPVAVRALIETQPASPTESEAVSKMVPDIGPCVPQGMEIALSKRRMRALFAASLYRIASAPR
jgi:hypothetical protein